MISTSRELARDLLKAGDDFITVKLKDKEYVIDSIGHTKSYFDSCATHLCLNIRDGGDGNIRR